MTFVVAEKGRLRMTCKDCVCYEKCKSSRLDFAESANPTHICKYFKNKTDVVEVKHGRWIGRLYDWGNEDEYPVLEKSNYLECSVCGYRHYLCIQDFFGHLHKVPVSHSQNIIPNGCPNCLARMNGDGTE